MAYIDAHGERVVEGRRLGVQPIWQVLTGADVQIAPSTYHAAKTRPPSARAVRDERLVPLIHHGDATAIRTISASTARGRSTPS